LEKGAARSAGDFLTLNRLRRFIPSVIPAKAGIQVLNRPFALSLSKGG
jgi:hypothetical protein